MLKSQGNPTAAIDAAVGNLSSILPGDFTVDTLPDPAANTDRYARVTDLFGVKRDLVLASQVGAVSFWQPVRPIFASTQAVTSNMTLTALKSPSVMYLTGNLGGSRTITLAPDLAYPGASFEIAFDGALGLFNLSIIGLNGGNVLSLLAGGRRRVFWDLASASWKQFS